MTEAQLFFTREAIVHARELPVRDAVIYLHGLRDSIEDEEVKAPIQQIYMLLTESDRQLELIQTGQLKLNFNRGGRS